MLSLPYEMNYALPPPIMQFNTDHSLCKHTHRAHTLSTHTQTLSTLTCIALLAPLVTQSVFNKVEPQNVIEWDTNLEKLTNPVLDYVQLL